MQLGVPDREHGPRHTILIAGAAGVSLLYWIERMQRARLLPR